MRKLVIILIAALTLAGSSAFAQDDMMASQQWFGASFSAFPTGIVLYYGLNDLIAPGLDLRANLSGATFFNDAFAVTGGADVLYDLNLETDNDLPLAVYVGGGLGVGLSVGSEIGASFSARALAGAEFMLTDAFGVFGEVQVGLGLPVVFQPGVVIGLNYHF